MSDAIGNPKRAKQPRESKRKPKRTAHRIAAANPKSKDLIRVLRRRWKRAKADRRTRVHELLKLGCSIHGIAEDIHQPYSNVRYYSKAAPYKARRKVRIRPISTNGDSKQTPVAHGEEGKEETLDSLKKRVPQLIVDFVLTKLGSPDSPQNVQAIRDLFQFVRSKSSRAPNMTHPIHPPNPITISRLYELTGQRLLRNPEWLGEWLAGLLFSLELRSVRYRDNSPWEAEIAEAERTLFPELENAAPALVPPQRLTPSVRLAKSGFSKGILPRP